MHGSRSKIPHKNLVRQRCAEGFNSGVKVLSKCYDYSFPQNVHSLKCAMNAAIFKQHRPCFLRSQIIHLLVVVRYTNGPRPIPKRPLYIVRFRACSFRWEYPLHSLSSSSSFLRVLPRLPVTFISPFIFPSIACCRR
jgi:hypothetical protein